jgi:hypothetical protein
MGYLEEQGLYLLISVVIFSLTVVFTHTRRRWAFVCGLLAAGWREHGVP